MKILIVGGGIAGLTLGAKLKQQGRSPVIVEKAPAYRDIGYTLGLWPLGSCVFHGLGLFGELTARSNVTAAYALYDHNGALLSEMDLSRLLDAFGPYLMMDRTAVVDLLRQACEGLDLRMGTEVGSIDQQPDAVRVGFSDGSSEDFDIVVGCDGANSKTRDLVFGPQPVFETGWIGWSWWSNASRQPADRVTELWGDGFFIGAYACPGHVCIIFGYPEARLAATAEPEAVRRVIREHTADLPPTVARLGAALDDAETFFPWPMRDVRAKEWVRGRVVLCGDSAASFLPTAGVGASTALRAAASLADELSRADAKTAPIALGMFEKRVRQAVERNQSDSRTLARLMFVENKLLAWTRDELTRHVSPDKFLKGIEESMTNPF